MNTALIGGFETFHKKPHLRRVDTMTPRSNAVLQFPISKTPITVNRKVPIRLKNSDYRSREYLTEDEVDKLISAAGRVGRHGHRDET